MDFTTNIALSESRREADSRLTNDYLRTTGMRSYENFALGLAVLLFAAAVVRTARMPRPIAFLMGLSGVTYLVQGWTAGSEGFSPAHTFAIVLAEVL
ncbi:MAG TPA: hypothetical protein VNG89_04495, partial [Vicinamibacterales bacterium]|nr:hypothetical protein [Vicinamibacterales bacterium]